MMQSLERLERWIEADPGSFWWRETRMWILPMLRDERASAEARERLMQLYAGLMDEAMDAYEGVPGMLARLRSLREEDMISFLIAECLGSDGLVDPERLGAATAREIAKGRLETGGGAHRRLATARLAFRRFNEVIRPSSAPTPPPPI